MRRDIKEKLRAWADHYEKASFLEGDPSWFMHQVRGTANAEVMAFLAAALSFGSRPVFMKKIEWLRQQSAGEPAQWVASGAWQASFPEENQTFYRFFKTIDMRQMLSDLEEMVSRYGGVGSYLRESHAGPEAIKALTSLTLWFNRSGRSRIIPATTSSACKRLCMLLRWMVRTDSPVDMGLWSDLIDRRTLIMPFDAHVMQEANALGLIHTQSATMSTARRLTDLMLEVFPDDPVKADFALFGYGVEASSSAINE